ncbi:hypothetical protein [Nocardia nepalensis]|uniref:hypothetical protein n=1 Tax=Nocardia nepalensis TaxID=3375448 RepID=UPI003B6804C2
MRRRVRGARVDVRARCVLRRGIECKGGRLTGVVIQIHALDLRRLGYRRRIVRWNPSYLSQTPPLI